MTIYHILREASERMTEAPRHLVSWSIAGTTAVWISRSLHHCKRDRFSSKLNEQTRMLPVGASNDDYGARFSGHCG
jgi:hypothetical protein